MIANLTYRDREIERQLRLLVGSSFAFWKRIQLRGTGSPRFVIGTASSAIEKLLSKSNSTNYANIELRPSGVLVGFKSGLSTYVLAIPYSRLSIQSQADSIQISNGDEHIAFAESKGLNLFLEKLQLVKEQHAQIYS